MTTKKHLFYGTLRKGHENVSRDKTYNYERFGSGTQKYIKTLRIPGYKMYDLGHYPCIVESDNNNKEITVELHEVNEEAAQKISFMEKGAGYLSKNIEIGEEKAIIYFYPKELINKLHCQDSEIKSGDWCS